MRGRYELQLFDDADKPASNHGSGAILGIDATLSRLHLAERLPTHDPLPPPPPPATLSLSNVDDLTVGLALNANLQGLASFETSSNFDDDLSQLLAGDIVKRKMRV